MCGMELLRFRSLRRNRRLGGSLARKVQSSKAKGQSSKVWKTKDKSKKIKDKRDKWLIMN